MGDIYARMHVEVSEQSFSTGCKLRMYKWEYQVGVQGLYFLSFWQWCNCY